MENVLIVPGGGIYFFWMIGFLEHALERLGTNTVMLTASSGALAAVLACCGVDTKVAAEAVCRTAEKHSVSSRWLGLAGVLGACLEDWLEEVLPEDAADRVRGRVRVLVNTAFPHQTILVSNFRTKQSLIEWVRAACHLPFFTDYKPFYRHRGMWCYDAGIRKGKQEFCGLMSCDESTYYVDYESDPTHDHQFKCRFIDYDVMVGLAGRGAFYARHLEGCGWFDNSRAPNIATNTANASKNTPNSS